MLFDFVNFSNNLAVVTEIGQQFSLEKALFGQIVWVHNCIFYGFLFNFLKIGCKGNDFFENTNIF